MTHVRLILLLLALLSGGVLVVGCDGQVVTDGATEVVLDVRSLFRTAEGEHCVSVVDSLQLTVTEADGTEQHIARPLTAEATELRIPVVVGAGTATFEAAVLSNNGIVLYRGIATGSVEANGFEVGIDVEATDAVLKACPDRVPLTLAGNDYRGTLRLINRGDRAATWSAAFDSPMCDNEPCFRLIPSDSTIAAGDTVALVGVFRAARLGDAIDVRITSDVGVLAVPFVVDAGGLVASPDTVVVGEDGTIEIDVLANDVDDLGAPLSLLEVDPAFPAGTTVHQGDRVLYVAEYEPRWSMTDEVTFGYVVGAAERRAAGVVTVRVNPCIEHEVSVDSDDPDVLFYSENGVSVTTRSFEFEDGTEGYNLAAVATRAQPVGGLALTLDNAAVEFDWSAQPVRYVRFDFEGTPARFNIAFDGGDRVVVPDLTLGQTGPPGVTVRVEDGSYGARSRIVFEAAEAPIRHLLLGGGDLAGDARTLEIDDVCFGLAAPDG